MSRSNAQRALRLWWVAAVLVGACGPDVPPRDLPDPFCRERPRLPFCEDFDEAPLPGVFDEVLADGGGTVVADESDSASGAAAMRARVPSTGVAMIRHRDALGWKYRVFLQARIDALPSEGEAELIAFTLDADGADDYRIALVTRAGQWFVVETREGVRTEWPGSVAFPLGRWVSTRFDYEVLATGEARVHVRFGNDSTVNVTTSPPASEAVPTIDIGVRASGGGPWDARFDNVTFDLN